MHFRRAFKDSIPVLMGYSTMGFASGLLLAVGGAISWSPLWAAATSAAFVSGPLQYIFVDWMATSLALGSVLLVTLCVIMLLIVAYPLYYILVASFSNPYDMYAGKTFLMPSGFRAHRSGRRPI